MDELKRPDLTQSSQNLPRLPNSWQARLQAFWKWWRFSPVRLQVIVIGGIALAHVIAMFIGMILKGWPYALQVLVDTAVMTIIIYPLIYLLVFKPLLQYIQRQAQTERIAEARLRLMDYARTHTIDELLQYILDVLEALTGSSIGFLHYLEADQKAIKLQAWSSNTLQKMCTTQTEGSHADIERAGVWAEAARTRRPVIHNHYAALPGRKGLPEGHAPLSRQLVVPTIRDNRVVALTGIGNKVQEYTPNDLALVSALADFAWDIVERKLSENAMREQKQKETVLTQTLQTLQIDIARDLHDTLGQNISYLRMNLEHLSESEWQDTDMVKGQLRHMTTAANEAYELIRTMLAVLKTGEPTDPIDLFSRYAERVAQRAAFQVEICHRGIPRQLYPRQIHQLFYIFREALSNVEKYARANWVEGEFVWGEGELTLIVSDNGCGFDPQTVQSASHYGLQFMRERAELLMGDFSVQSAAGQGTKITVRMPYEIEMPVSSS